MVRAVGAAPSDFDCAACPAYVRGQRFCPKPPADLWDGLQLQEARRRGHVPPPDPTHPDACPVARIEADPRALDALHWAPIWREHGDGPGGRGLSWQPLHFLEAVAHLDAEQADVERRRREDADADARAKRQGIRL